MFKNFKLSHTAFIIAEVIIFYVLARWGRNLLDALLAPYALAPALLIVVRIVFVVLIILAAIAIDRLVFKLLTNRGWLQ